MIPVPITVMAVGIYRGMDIQPVPVLKVTTEMQVDLALINNLPGLDPRVVPTLTARALLTQK